MTYKNGIIHAAALSLLLTSALAQAHDGGIRAEAGNAPASSDIVHAKVYVEGDGLVFHMAVAGKAGQSKPTPVGTVAGSDVFAYVWPTTIDSAEVGFEAQAGILAMAVTAHPDFDDTPLDDENGDGDPGNDGNVWHSHWVVLGPDETCGPGGLKVIDIPEGAAPKLPETWPNLPLLIDSPGHVPTLEDDTVEVRAPFADVGRVADAQFDAAVAGLRINANLHAPLLCVTDVLDIASGDLSLPGKVNQ